MKRVASERELQKGVVELELSLWGAILDTFKNAYIEAN